MMAGMGIACDAGEVRGAHCDGKFNLRWHGRKLAGTAACITRSGGRAVRLFHASLAVSGPIEQDLAAIRRFETALGEPCDYDPAARSEEQTSELQSIMRNSYAGFCLKKKNTRTYNYTCN